MGALIVITPEFESELEISNDLLGVIDVIASSTITLKLLPVEGRIVKLLEIIAFVITEALILAVALTVRVDPEILQPVPDVPVSPVLEIVSV